MKACTVHQHQHIQHTSVNAFTDLTYRPDLTTLHDYYYLCSLLDVEFNISHQVSSLLARFRLDACL